MRDRRIYGIKHVREMMFINPEWSAGVDRMLAELRLSYRINLSREDLVNVALESMLAKPVSVIAEYIRGN